MAKSKLVKVNQKIAKKVVGTHKKIENGVVGGYKRIEHGVVSGFNKIADGFVDEFLTREGESVAEARQRLEEEKAARRKAGKNNEKEYICSNDIGNNRRNFICAGDVYGVDTGMECFSSGRWYGRDRSRGTSDHGNGMEKDGE